MERRIVVLGLGNLLFGDEGLGVQAVQQLAARYRLPPEVQVLDGGTIGLGLLAYIEDATDLLIVDAMAHAGAEAGTLFRLEGPDIRAALAQKMSVHQIGLDDIMAAGLLRGRLPPRIALWGMVPAEMDLGLELSSAVARRLPDLLAAVAGELREWGVPVEPA